MRDIIFKGKRKDNSEWVEGYLFDDGMVDSKRMFIGSLVITEHKGLGEDVWDIGHAFYEVLPETVGQYTGLTDKNGKKIFEGDIVRTQPYSDRPYSKKQKFKSHIGIVRYEVRHFKNSLYEQDYEAKWNVYIKDYDGYFCYDWSPFFKCEVIGNIHDNPELLEVK